MNNTFETCVTPLFVPATRPGRFEKAAQSGADAIIVDLKMRLLQVRKLQHAINSRKQACPKAQFCFA